MSILGFDNIRGEFPVNIGPLTIPTKLSKALFLSIFVVVMGWFCVLIGNRPLATPDEGRYVEIPREMVVTGDYITPRLNGVKYFEKPPLMYWLEAAAYKVFGVNEGALRLWIAFLSACAVMFVFYAAWRFFSPFVAFSSVFVLATSPLYYALSRMIILDIPVTAFVTAALLSFFLAVYEEKGLRRRLWSYGFYASCALGVLTKGIVVLALAGPIILLWAIVAKRWSDLWPAYLPTGILLFLAIATPWHVLAAIKNPEFLHKYFYVEHFLRYTTSIHARYKPFWFFVPILFLGFYPWILLLPKIRSVFREMSREQRDVILFCAIWATFVFVFYSIGNSKLIPYLLPVFPPLSLIVGCVIRHLYITYLKNNLSTERSVFLWFGGTAFLIFVSGLGALYGIPDLVQGQEALIPYIHALLVFFMWSSISGFFSYLTWQPIYAMCALFLLPIGIIGMLILASPHIQKPSVNTTASFLKENRQPEDRVVAYLYYPQDLPFYLNETITVVEGKNELDFGCAVDPATAQWMISVQDFATLWAAEQRLLVVVRDREWPYFAAAYPNVSPVFQTSGFYVVTNKSEVAPAQGTS